MSSTVLIILIIFSAIVAIQWINRRPQDTSEQKAMQAEISQLRQRIEALEAIVTSQGYDVAQQIDQLRQENQQDPKAK